MYFHIKLPSEKVQVKRWPFTEWTEVIQSAFVCSTSWVNHIFLLYNAVEAASLDFEDICHWSFLIHPRRLLNNSFLNSSFHCWKETSLLEDFLEVWENSGKKILSPSFLPAHLCWNEWTAFGEVEEERGEGKGHFTVFWLSEWWVLHTEMNIQKQCTIKWT